MSNIKMQSKVSKADATQEMITAQNSNNQSDKLFGTFTDDEMRNIVYNSEQDFIKPNYVINYLKQAEHILDKARMSDENKNFIKGAFQMMAGFGQWNTNTKEKYEYIAQRDYPDDIRTMLEEGDEEVAVDALEYEIGILCSDLQNDEYLWFPKDEKERALEALEEYCSLIREYKLQDMFSWNIFDEIDKVLAA